MERLHKGELPPLMGIFKTCKICEISKDQALFKWQNGRPAGMVCRECDLKKKRNLYKTNEVERERAKVNAKEWRENNATYAKQIAKNWKIKNIDKVKARRKSYHEENTDIINTKTSKWYKENKERHNANSKKYQENNKERLARLRQEYYQENKSYFAEQGKKWRKNNPHLTTAYVRLYNLAKIKRTPPWADIKAIIEFYKNCPEGYQVDHIHPLQGKLISGLHVIENLQYLTPAENHSKQRKFKPYWVFYEPTGTRIEVI